MMFAALLSSLPRIGLNGFIANFSEHLFTILIAFVMRIYILQLYFVGDCECCSFILSVIIGLNLEDCMS